MFGIIMERMPLIGNNDNKRTCCGFEIIDKSEPLLIAGACISLGGFIFALVAGPVGLAVVTGVLTVSSLVAEWRVRSLGIAKKLMDSVRDLKDENERLKDTNEEKLDYNLLSAKEILNQVSKLKNNYKVAITLNLIEGYDYEEIAQIMDISYENSRTTVSRAKNKLRQLLSEQNER